MEVNKEIDEFNNKNSFTNKDLKWNMQIKFVKIKINNAWNLLSSVTLLGNLSQN